jgi:hypothetical protein
MAIRPPTNPAAPGAAANPAAAPARPKFGAPSGPGTGFPAPATAPRPQMPMSFAPAAVQAPAPAPAAAATQMGVDIFDIPAEDFNPAAEAAENIAPIPPDDGDHVVELALQEGNREAYREISWQQKTNEGEVTRGAVSLALTATIASDQDPFNGRRMYFDVTSFGKKAVGVEGSTNDVSLLLRALGEDPTGRPKTDAYRAMELIKGGYNKIITATEWHAEFPYDKENPKKNKRPYKVGQENFPRDEAGIPQPLYETPAGEPLRTRAVPVRFSRLA